MVLVNYFTVGQVAARLGVATPTVRTWDRRYGLSPSGRTPGGHRRYTRTDIERMQRVRDLVVTGMAPSKAVKLVGELDQEAGRTRSSVVHDVIDAVTRLDASDLATAAHGAITQMGVIEAWDRVLGPALVELDRQWELGSIPAESEPFATTRLLRVLRDHPRAPAQRHHRPVILVCVDEGHHKLPAIATEAALAGAGVSVIELGSRVPSDSIAQVAEALDPAIVVVWSHDRRTAEDGLSRLTDSLVLDCEVIRLGEGWADAEPMSMADLAQEVLGVLRMTKAGARLRSRHDH